MHFEKFIFLGRIHKEERTEEKYNLKLFQFTLCSCLQANERFSKETFISSLLFSNLSKLKSHMSSRVAQIRFGWVEAALLRNRALHSTSQ